MKINAKKLSPAAKWRTLGEDANARYSMLNGRILRLETAKEIFDIELSEMEMAVMADLIARAMSEARGLGGVRIVGVARQKARISRKGTSSGERG
jgi:hypothetical protein